MAVEVKICGLTRPADAALAVSHGASRLGVIFAGGPRNVSARQAMEVVAAAGSVPVLGVFGTEAVASILDTTATTGLRGAQLHGDYQERDIETLRTAGLEVWFVVRDIPGQSTADRIGAVQRMLDAVVIEPEYLDRERLDHPTVSFVAAAGIRRAFPALRMVLAGGLTPENVVEAIRVVGPDLVDVSSGVEIRPGIKDASKLSRFLERVRDARIAT